MKAKKMAVRYPEMWQIHSIRDGKFNLQTARQHSSLSDWLLNRYFYSKLMIIKVKQKKKHIQFVYETQSAFPITNVKWFSPVVIASFRYCVWWIQLFTQNNAQDTPVLCKDVICKIPMTIWNSWSWTSQNWEIVIAGVWK